MRPGRLSVSRRVALGLILPALWGQAARCQEDHAAPGIARVLELQEMLHRRAIRALQERADEVRWEDRRREDRRKMERREQERTDERRRDAQRDVERRRAIEADERRAWERRR